MGVIKNGALKVAEWSTINPSSINAVPATSSAAPGVAVPMPSPSPLTKRDELTTVLAPLKTGTYPAVPPVVVTLEVALGVMAGETALAAAEAAWARAKAEGGRPPRVAASAALSA